MPVLRDPGRAEDRDVLLPGMLPNEYAIINREWRYIRYADGAEELYDVRRDPNEWYNLAADPDRAEVKQRLSASAPGVFAQPGPPSSELKLVVDGERFAWASRRGRRVEALPASVPGATMVPRASDQEARMGSVEAAGRSAWFSSRRDGKPTYFYFNLEDPAFKDGNQPAVQVAITYLDRGNTTAVVEYDSDDPNVNQGHVHGTGVFKEGGRFPVRDSGAWEQVVLNLSDARFSSRCNGADLRIGFAGPDVDPVVAEVLVRPLRSEDAE